MNPRPTSRPLSFKTYTPIFNMVSFSSITFIALAYLSCLVNASPLAVRDPLDVAAPPVTYPTQGVVWTVGQTQTVTWYVCLCILYSA